MSKRPFRIGRARTGLGLFATQPIKKREFIVRYRGRVIANDEAERLEARGSRYMFEINSRWTIDGSPRWNIARYVNHSCRPNTEAIERRGPIIVYVARRKIKPGEELTIDYGKDYFDSFITSSGCKCDKCRERRAARQAEYRAKRKRAEARAARKLAGTAAKGASSAKATTRKASTARKASSAAPKASLAARKAKSRKTKPQKTKSQKTKPRKVKSR